MNYIIITGANRGLGKALAQKLVSSNNTLILIYRNAQGLNEISYLDQEEDTKTRFYELDLLNYKKIPKLMESITQSINISMRNSDDAIILINNASIIKPINRFDNLTLEEIEENLTVNCIAQTVLINCFLKNTNIFKIERKIINISSGVINNSLFGWSLYSAGKSTIHSIIQTIAKENKSDLLRLVSFDPGVMDTKMQENIRSVEKEKFEDVEVFLTLNNEKKLRQPIEVATIIEDAYISNWKAKNIFERISHYDRN